jgi:hypothetical protein
MLLRAIVAFALSVPSCAAVREASDPPNFPIGVRSAASR